MNTSFNLDEEKIDQSVNAVRVTDDYGKFNFDSKNRQVNPGHLEKLKASINKSNLLSAQPITVNKAFEIIDGQHRFTAARELELPVYYIMEEGLTIEDAITLNINTKNWTYKDYLKYWIDQGNEEYIYFERFMEEYGISYSVSAGMLGLGQATSGNMITDVFNSGKFKAKYKDYAERVGDMLMQLKEYGNFANSRSFILAFDDVMDLDEFSFDLFLKKVEMVPDRFTKCSNTESYLRMMEDVINYHNKGQRIRLY